MNQIKTGAIISYVSLFINIVIGLLYTPWMISTIGMADYGLYTLAMSVISLFVFDFGLGSAITRFVSKYLAEGRQDKVDNLLGLVFKLYLLGNLIVLVGLAIIYFIIPSLYQGLTLAELHDFKIVYLISALFCVISFPFIPLNGIITSYEKFIQLKTCDLLHKLIIVVLMTCCLLFGGGLFYLVIVNSVAGILIIFFKLAVLGRAKLTSIRWRFWDKEILKTVFIFSVWVTIIQLAQRCIFNLSPSILAAYAGSQSITILGIAICLEGYTFSFANAINGMFLPKVSRMVANNNNKEILNLMTRVGRIQIYIIGAMCVGFICVGHEFIETWLGESFSEVYLCALMIILPSFLQLPQEIGNTTIVAEGKVKLQAFAFILMAVINLILAFPLTKFYGVEGLCCSIMIAYLARTIAMDAIFYIVLKINIFKFFKHTYFEIFPTLILATALTLFGNSFIHISGWLGVCVKSSLCVFIYSGLVFFISMNKEEKIILYCIIKFKRR